MSKFYHLQDVGIDLRKDPTLGSGDFRLNGSSTFEAGAGKRAAFVKFLEKDVIAGPLGVAQDTRAQWDAVERVGQLLKTPATFDAGVSLAGLVLANKSAITYESRLRRMPADLPKKVAEWRLLDPSLTTSEQVLAALKGTLPAGAHVVVGPNVDVKALTGTLPNIEIMTYAQLNADSSKFTEEIKASGAADIRIAEAVMHADALSEKFIASLETLEAELGGAMSINLILATLVAVAVPIRAADLSVSSRVQREQRIKEIIDKQA